MPFAVVQATFWDHGTTTFAPVQNPTWDAVAAELGRPRSASLSGAETAGEAVTGFGTLTLQRHQAGWLVTALAVGAGRPVWLTDPAGGDKPAALGCCGGTKLPGKYIVPDAAAVAAARHFFAGGTCAPDLAWTGQPPASGSVS